MSAIRINVTINAKPKDIYDALTTQKGLSGWWAKNTKASPQIGNINTFTFGDFINEMEVKKLQEDSRVEWKCIRSIEDWIDTTIIFDLEEIDETKTILRFTHKDWKMVNDVFAGCTYDWSRFLMSLKSLSETGKGSPA